MSDQHNNSDTLLTECVVLLNLFNSSVILSVAGGIFLVLSIIKVLMDIYYHPRRKGEDQSGEPKTEERNVGPYEQPK